VNPRYENARTARNLRLLAATGVCALVSQSCFCFTIVRPTPPTRWTMPSQAPLPFGKTDLQIVDLSTEERFESESAQILLDSQGVASVFWAEFLRESAEHRLFFKQRLPDGSWLEAEELDYAQFNTDKSKLVRGEDGEICLTYYEEKYSPILHLRCKTDSGWEETDYVGNAPDSTTRLVLFLDGGSIRTAYIQFTNSDGYRLSFGGRKMKCGEGEASDFDLIQDADGVYYLVCSSKSYKGSAEFDYQLSIWTSDDRGETWTSAVLSTNPAQSPRFFLARDGTLYLFWGERGGEDEELQYMHRSPGEDWQSGEIDLTKEDIGWIEEIFLGEDGRGDLQIILKTSSTVQRLHGSISRGFSDPQRIWDLKDAGDTLSQIAFAVGTDGILYFVWNAYRTADPRISSTYFGFLAPGE
jgi:hypothetical protein